MHPDSFGRWGVIVITEEEAIYVCLRQTEWFDVKKGGDNQDGAHGQPCRKEYVYTTSRARADQFMFAEETFGINWR